MYLKISIPEDIFVNLSEKAQKLYDNLRFNRYMLKPYLIKDGKKHPFALICPGGAYVVCASWVEGVPFAKELNKRGYHAFVLYYRVRSKARYPAPQDDVERAVHEVFDHAEQWNVDTACWSLWGSSAGGHLVSSFCLEERQIQKPGALILTYPVVTMDDLTHDVTRRTLLGKNPTAEMIERLSVEKQVSSEYPPTYVWCGTADSTVNPRNSIMLERALKEQGVAVRLDVFENIEHGVGLGDGLPWFSHAVEFWEEQMEK